MLWKAGTQSRIGCGIRKMRLESEQDSESPEVGVVVNARYIWRDVEIADQAKEASRSAVNSSVSCHKV